MAKSDQTNKIDIANVLLTRAHTGGQPERRTDGQSQEEGDTERGSATFLASKVNPPSTTPSSNQSPVVPILASYSLKA